MESNKITTSCLCSTNLFAFSMTISATCTCRCGGSSKVDATTSPRTVRSISVTSSGRSSMSNTIRYTSGLFLLMDWARVCSRTVLPAFGGATMMERWPLPMGAIRSMMRPVKSSVVPLPSSSLSCSVGNRGVRFSKISLWRERSGVSKLISLTLSKAK